jgi:hypothetical protein
VSGNHAYADAFPAPATTSDLSNVAAVFMGAVRASVARLAATIARRRSRDLSRYSDHLLADIGFERDWDGSVIRVTKD